MRKSTFLQGGHNNQSNIYSETQNRVRKMIKRFLVIFLALLATHCHGEAISDELVEESGRYIIEGRVYPPEYSGDSNWQANTRVSINDEYQGFLKEDGTFIINGVPSGSYVVEVINSDYFYEPVSGHPERFLNTT